MLIGWIAAVIGIIIVVFSLNRIIREIRRAGIPNLEDQSFSDTFYALLQRVDQMGNDLDDINQAFYESTERLEKRLEALESRKPPRPAAAPRRAAEPAPPAWDPAPGAAPVPSAAQPPSAEQAAAVQIRQLLQEGKDPQQIARELNLGVGEVELIRRLRPEKR